MLESAGRRTDDWGDVRDIRLSSQSIPDEPPNAAGMVETNSSLMPSGSKGPARQLKMQRREFVADAFVEKSSCADRDHCHADNGGFAVARRHGGIAEQS